MTHPMEKEPASHPQEKPARSILDTAKFIAIVTSALAVLATLTGAYYQVGQLEGFHLPQSYFPVQLEDTPRLVHQALFSITFKYVLKAVEHRALVVVAILGGLYAGGLCLLKLTKASDSLKNEKVKRWLNRPLPLSGLVGLLTGATIFLLPRVILYLVALGLAAPLSGYYAGRRDAEDYLSEWKPCSDPGSQSTASRCSYIEFMRDLPDGTKRLDTLNGAIVVGNDRWVGVVTDDAVLVAPAHIERFSTQRPKATVIPAAAPSTAPASAASTPTTN